MSKVAEHYQRHLAPIYVWMAGGSEAALRAGSAELDALNLPTGPGTVALDLGAGFGMHSIPLARAGARVTAIDSSAELLRTMKQLRGDLAIEVVEDDILAFEKHVTEPPSLVLCMGDTLTHLPDPAAVERLIEGVAATLRPGGSFVLSLRDYSQPLLGDQRFIPVRSDPDRILTCFLEYDTGAVLVHDIIQERTAQGWLTRISHYQKLRLSPHRLIASLQLQGLTVRREAGLHGMVRLVARKSASGTDRQPADIHAPDARVEPGGKHNLEPLR